MNGQTLFLYILYAFVVASALTVPYRIYARASERREQVLLSAEQTQKVRSKEVSASSEEHRVLNSEAGLNSHKDSVGRNLVQRTSGHLRADSSHLRSSRRTT